MRNYILIVASISCILFLSCKRDSLNSTFVGPPSGVAFTTSSGLNTTTVDFASGQALFYKAELNQPVYWHIKIKGLVSGGVKEFSGYGNKIDSLNSAWFGTSDSLYFFRSGEICSFTLDISGKSEPFTARIVVLNAKPLPANLVFVVAGFEDGTVPVTYLGDPQSDGNNFDMTTQGYPYLTDSIKTVEGTYSAVFGGNLSSAPGKYFIGGTYFNGSTAGFKGFNPDSVFLNIFAKSAPAPFGNKITLQISESDGDVWSYDTPSISTDWKLYSVAYSNLYKGFGSIGNGLKNPDLLSQANINFVTVTAGGKVKCYVDVYSITYGKPFQP